MQRVVILGAGTGGTMTANLLAKRLRRKLRAGEATITVVGGDAPHVFQPANLDVAFRGAPPSRFVRAERPLLDKRVALELEAAERVDAPRNVVVLRSGREVPYDALVLATGAVPRTDLTPGFAEGALNFHTGPEDAAKIWAALESFAGGRVVIAIASVPYKCPPSPNEAAFLLDEHFRARGMRDKVEITLATPYPHAYPAAAISSVVEPRFEEIGVKVEPFFNVESVDPAKKVITSLEGAELPFDLLIGIPPHRGAEVISKSGLGDEEGWIPADKETMRVKDRANVWAIGDATAIPISKSGVVAHLQADVVAENVARQLAGEPGERAFEGRINCPMEVGHGRALFVSATYASPPKPDPPRVLKYAMKRAFGRMYWIVLRGRLEWMFGAYFGKTSHERAAK